MHVVNRCCLRAASASNKMVAAIFADQGKNAESTALPSGASQPQHPPRSLQRAELPGESAIANKLAEPPSQRRQRLKRDSNAGMTRHDALCGLPANVVALTGHDHRPRMPCGQLIQDR